MALDTVFDEQMKPVFADQPDVVLRRLKARRHESWVKVCIGETQRVVTIDEYLYKEKWDAAVVVIKELLRKSDSSLYRRDKSRLEPHILRAARQILDSARE